MAKRKTVEEMSAQELYELARQREMEEEAHAREAVRTRVEELKEQRRELLAKHKKELAAIEKELKELTGRSIRGASPGGRRTDVSQRVLAIIEKFGPISTKDLKGRLEEEGIDTTHLPQQLSYLKRQGRVNSPERTIYTIA